VPFLEILNVIHSEVFRIPNFHSFKAAKSTGNDPAINPTYFIWNKPIYSAFARINQQLFDNVNSKLLMEFHPTFCSSKQEIVPLLYRNDLDRLHKERIMVEALDNIRLLGMELKDYAFVVFGRTAFKLKDSDSWIKENNYMRLWNFIEKIIPEKSDDTSVNFLSNNEEEENVENKTI
jgi:hypothetical protein